MVWFLGFALLLAMGWIEIVGRWRIKKIAALQQNLTHVETQLHGERRHSTNLLTANTDLSADLDKAQFGEISEAAMFRHLMRHPELITDDGILKAIQNSERLPFSVQLHFNHLLRSKENRPILKKLTDAFLKEQDVGGHRWRKIGSTDYSTSRRNSELIVKQCRRCSMIHRFFTGEVMEASAEGYFLGGERFEVIDYQFPKCVDGKVEDRGDDGDDD